MKAKKVILNNVIKIENEVNSFLQELTSINYSIAKNLIIKQNYYFL